MPNRERDGLTGLQLRTRPGLLMTGMMPTTPAGAAELSGRQWAASRLMPPASAFEPGRELFRTPRQQARIGAHGCEETAELDGSARERLVAGQDAGNIATRLDAPDRVLDDTLHLRMSLVADIAEACGQISGSDKDAVDTLDASNRFQHSRDPAGSRSARGRRSRPPPACGSP